MAQGILNTPREVTHQRIAAALEDIVDKITDTSDADNINYNNTASGLQATKVQGAIDELASEKADKSTTLAGYGITDAYTKTESDNKYVAKETGKGLSTNDYTTADKNKLAGIEAEANKTVVDSFMSDSSTNPLQNKVITKELEGTKTTSGNPLTIEDAAPVNAVNLSMDLEPIQAGSGTPSPDNIRPISGRSDVAIQRVGKNLFGGLDFANSLYNASSTHALDTTNKTVQYNRRSGSSSTVLFNQFKENTEYTLILTGKVDAENTKNNSIMFRDSNEVELSTILFETTTKTRKKITVGGNGTTIKDLVLGWANGGVATLYYEECGIFEGNVSIEEFEEYLGKTYTIQIGQTVYGGQLDVTRGKMVVTHGYVDLGNYNWAYSTSENIPLFYFSRITIGAKSNSIVKCSNYKYLPNFWQSSANDYCIAVGSNAINISDSRFNNASDFKTAMSGVQMTFELATPFTLDLTPTQIKLLENTNTIYTDYEGDTITIEYQLNNAIGEAVRAVEESYDAEFAVRPPLKKIAFSGTTDSDGSVTLINASDIPSNHRIIPLHITDMTIDGSAGTYFVEYEPYNSGDSVKGYCYFYMSGSQMFPVGKAITGNFYYYDLEG